jgi:hypothetical protein
MHPSPLYGLQFTAVFADEEEKADVAAALEAAD